MSFQVHRRRHCVLPPVRPSTSGRRCSPRLHPNGPWVSAQRIHALPAGVTLAMVSVRYQVVFVVCMVFTRVPGVEIQSAWMIFSLFFLYFLSFCCWLLAFCFCRFFVSRRACLTLQGAGAGAERARATPRQPVGPEKHSGGQREPRPRRKRSRLLTWKPYSSFFFSHPGWSCNLVFLRC